VSLDLYRDQLQQDANTRPVTSTVEPGFTDNFFRGTGMLATREAAKVGRAASMALSTFPIIGDKITGGTVLQDKYFAAHDTVFKSAVDFWTPKPGEVGLAAEIAGPLLGILPQVLLSPAAAVASQTLGPAEDLINEPGVTAGQAIGVGLTQGAGFALGIWAPAALGYNLPSRVAAGAGMNWFQGVVTRGASASILEGTEAAKNFPAFGGKEQIIDILLGAAFGGAAHVVPGWRAESERVTDQLNVKGRKEINDEMGVTTQFDLGAAAARATNNMRAAGDAERAQRLQDWADSLQPSDKAALAVHRIGQHLNIDSAPGKPTGPLATDIHVERMRSTIDSILRGDPLPPEPVPRETIDQFTTRVGQELGEPLGLAPEVALLQRAYIEQGPEAGRAMLDELADQVPDRPDGFVGQAHQQLTERAQQYKDAETPFAPDPQREADAMEITRGMQEAAPRIAREEGLPEGPTILLPVQDQLKAHLTETGFQQADGTWRKMTPQEADRYIADHAALDAVNLRAMADLTGGMMSPEQLLHRYLADVKMRAPAPAGALEQRRLTPAQHIAEFKPTVAKSEYGGTAYSNKYVELGNSVATNSKGEKGERRTFEIMDKTQGNATTVGFVIVEIDRNGKFAALRNIEIRKDIQGKGLGENVVATMVAHNGPGYTMDVVDITHGGKVDSDEDALPFWKKVGTQLKNYSSDPNVQMDGMLSLEDYLGARSGPRTDEGRGRGAAQAVPADRAGAGTARGSLPGSGPTAADRAELARLNGTALFQSTWYHSALSRAIDATPTKAQPAQGWKDWLKGQIQKGAIKADEVKYTGLEEYLDLQPGKITKEQLQTFMQEGGVRVEEVELGADGANAIRDAFDREGYDIEEQDGAMYYTDPQGDGVEFDDLPISLQSVINFRDDEHTRFSNWQLPGAKEGSYRELALVMPTNAFAGREKVFEEYRPRIEALYAKLDKAVGAESARLTNELRALQDERNARADKEGGYVESVPAYRTPSAHSMGDKADINRLAHIRFNERTGPNGERVLFIEEIQSDWAQAGKKHGFGGPEPFVNFSTWAESRGMSREDWKSMWDTQNSLVGDDKKVWQEWKNFQIRNANSGLRPPPGPFVGKTDAWVGLSLKRMIRYAAENGFDQIAWTTGEQQAARYDLSKHISKIEYEPISDPAGTYEVYAYDLNGKEVLHEDEVPINRVEELLGKEIAKKVVDGEGEKKTDAPARDWRALSGLDLKVGGEGMKGFYDKIVPSVAKDVLKKLGGGTVGKTDIGKRYELEETNLGQGTKYVVVDRQAKGQEDVMFESRIKDEAVQWLADHADFAIEQQAITITPEMRTKAMESQALFQTDPFGLKAFGINSLDDLSPAYRTPDAWREVPAVMRDVDAARALRKSVIDLEQGLNRQFGWKEGLQPVWVNLDQNGNLSIGRALWACHRAARRPACQNIGIC
jgi:hypothetical protein